MKSLLLILTTKAFTVILLMWMILGTGCSKKSEGGEPNVVGIWELREQQSGMLPGTTFPAGSGREMRFTSTNYTITNNGVVQEQGVYRIATDTFTIDGECLGRENGVTYYRLIFNNNIAQSKRIQIQSADQFVLLSGCAALDYGTYAKYQRR